MTYRSVLKLSAIVLSLAIAIPFFTGYGTKASAFSVCGTRKERATFKTKSYLITICPGEASYQLILTFHDGTGYQRIPVQQEGRKFRGSDGKHNYIIDRQQFIIGTDGEQPIRESVIQSSN